MSVPPPPPPLYPHVYVEKPEYAISQRNKKYIFLHFHFILHVSRLVIFGSLKTFYENRMTRHFRGPSHTAHIRLAKFRTRVMHVIGKINENIILFVCGVRV